MSSVVIIENWRDIQGYLGYQISDLGRVRSCRPAGFRRKWGSWRFLKPYKMKNGYLTVDLYDNDGKKSKRLVHRLVLEAFAGNCPLGMEARHVDNNDRTDNRLDNLCWGTRTENQADRRIHGTDKRGSQLPWAKLTEDQVRQIKARLAQGDRPCTLAREFQVQPGTILKIRKAENWAHVSLF